MLAHNGSTTILVTTTTHNVMQENERLGLNWTGPILIDCRVAFVRTCQDRDDLRRLSNVRSVGIELNR